MFFYPEDKPNNCCRGCGTIRVNRRTCTQCRCTYCKSDGHPYVECPKVKGKNQPRTYKATGVLAGGPPLVKPGKHARCNQECEQGGRPPKRMRFESSIDLTIATSQSSMTTERFSDVFPDLNDLFKRVIDVMCSSDDRLLQDYGNFIRQKFAKHELLEILSECIDVEIQNLQGKSLTVEAMQEVKRRQSLRKCMFNGAGGYLDFLTDVRDHDYLKFYVGQSVDVAERVRRHTLNLLRGEVGYLHYYICVLGGGNRHFNFIRLFRTPSLETLDLHLTREDRAILMNILELAMGLAFRSLPNNVYNQFSETPMPPERSYMHLNVLSPLEQGHEQSQHARRQARDQLEFSSDPEIRTWPKFRQVVLNRQPKTKKGCPTFEELREKVSSVIHKAFPKISPTSIQDFASMPTQIQAETFDMAAALRRSCEAIGEDCDLDITLDKPIGSLQGSLAVIYGISRNYTYDNGLPRQCRKQFPFELEKVGLTAENSLVWPLDFGTLKNIDSSKLGQSSSICDNLDTLSVDMLDASCAKVVIVSGKHVQRFISDYAQSLNLSRPQQMQLQSQEITFRIEERNGIMRRIYIDAPELETVVHGYGWVQRKRMSGALKLASLFLGSISFNYRFYEIAKAKDGVFEAIIKARKGENVSLDSLSEAARDWLGRRGFKTTEDINELVTIGGGSLGQSLHILYCVLRFICSKIPQNQPLAAWKRPSITFGDGKLFSKRMQVAMANLWYRKIEDEQEKLRIQIQRRHTSTPALAGEKLTQEVLDDMALRTVTKEENEKEMANPSSDTEMNMYLAESQGAQIARSNEINFPATESHLAQVGTHVQDQLLRKQVKALRAKKPDRLHQILDAVTHLKAQGQSFETICSQFPDFTANQVRRAMNPGTISGVTGSKWNLKGERRVFEMMRNGCVLQTESLNLLGQKLVWNFGAAHAQRGIELGRVHRVWIQFFKPGEPHPTSWYRVASRPDLCTFIFRVARLDEDIQRSVSFYPKVQGFTKNETEHPREELLMREEALASGIVCAFNNMRRGG